MAFDPIALYIKYPRQGDFLIIWAILTLLIKWIFVRMKYTAKQVAAGKHPVKSFFGSVVGLTDEDKKTLFSLEGGISILFALAATAAGMAYQGWSLKAVFTGGSGPLFLALIAGALGYGSASMRTTRGSIKWITALLVFSLSLGILAPKGPRFDWINSFFWPILLFLIMFNLMGEYKKPGKGRGRGGADRTPVDIEKSKAQIKKAAAESAEAAKKVDGILKVVPDLLKLIKDTKEELAERFSRLEAGKALQALALSGMAIATQLFSQGASVNDVKAELRRRNYDAQTITAVVETLSPQVGMRFPPRAPARAVAPPPVAGRAAPAPPTARPAPTTIIPTPTVISDQDVRSMAKEIDEISKKHDALTNKLSDYGDIVKMIDVYTKDVQMLVDQGKVIEDDLTQREKDARELLQKAEATPLENDAVQVHTDSLHVRNEADLAKQQLSQVLQPVAPILASHSTKLQQIAEEVSEKIKELGDNLQLLQKNLRRVESTKGGVGQPDLDLYLAVYPKVDGALTDISQILRDSMDELNTLAVSLPSVKQAVENYQKAIDDVEKRAADIMGRFSNIEEKLVKAEQEKIAPAMIEGDKIVKLVSDFQIIAREIEPSDEKGPMQKLEDAEIRALREKVADSIRLLHALEQERVKIENLPTHTRELSKIAKLLADLRGIGVWNVLIQLDNALNPSRGEPDYQLVSLLVWKFRDEEYAEMAYDILKELKVQVTNLPKGQLLPSA